MERTTDGNLEEAWRGALRSYVLKLGQTNPDKNVEELSSLDGARDRLNYIVPRLPLEARRRVLISGCAAGSEMVAAREAGFVEVHGADVQPDLVAIARQRLEPHGFSAVLYDGSHLPYAAGFFTAVLSGHVIEHTASPFRYLREHLRVLEAGGFLFLEFPDRYHSVELHTGLPSVEFLPGPLRSLALRARASPFSSYSEQQRRHYEEIRLELKPMSVWQVHLYLARIGKARVIHHYSPAPGFCRMLIQKD